MGRGVCAVGGAEASRGRRWSVPRRVVPSLTANICEPKRTSSEPKIHILSPSPSLYTGPQLLCRRRNSADFCHFHSVFFHLGLRIKLILMPRLLSICYA